MLRARQCTSWKTVAPYNNTGTHTTYTHWNTFRSTLRRRWVSSGRLIHLEAGAIQGSLRLRDCDNIVEESHSITFYALPRILFLWGSLLLPIIKVLYEKACKTLHQLDERRSKLCKKSLHKRKLPQQFFGQLTLIFILQQHVTLCSNLTKKKLQAHPSIAPHEITFICWSIR